MRNNENLNNANITIAKDIEKVLDFFRYKTDTSLSCALETGILRNSVTWYIDDLERLGMLQAVSKGKDPTTGYRAKFYSADPKKWVKKPPQQLSLFNLGGGLK